MADANFQLSGADDPFFRLSDNSDWNACIGEQGDEENYVDGYIEAAIELVNAVVEKRMYRSRDTLVLPILYNARHALELALKFALSKLHEVGVIEDAHPKNHDILSHWLLLNAHSPGDEALEGYVIALEPYVASLSRIDDSGQELRYSENQKGKKSLAGRSLANIEVIRGSLHALKEVLEQLKDRVIDLVAERSVGSHTTECSRRDLMEIAKMLPGRSEWSGPKFVDVKEDVMKRFRLSSRKFSKAINVIECNREMRCLIGLETNLVHLTDKNILFAVEQWTRRHTAQPIEDGSGIYSPSEDDIDTITTYQRVANEVNKRILEVLLPDKLADLQVIYYIGRDDLFCEYYEQKLETARKEHLAAGNLAEKVDHLIAKTNFKEAVTHGALRLGRIDLARQLKNANVSATSARCS